MGQSITLTKLKPVGLLALLGFTLLIGACSKPVRKASGAATSIAYSTDVNRGGVAFWAHVGGFVAGMVMIKIFPERPQRNRYGTW